MSGRYYFSPAGAPFVPGPTLFASKTWDANGTVTGKEPAGSVPVVLGEVRGSPGRWDSGALPVQVPNNQLVGSLDCLLSGESVLSAVPVSEVDGGFLSACYIAPPAPNVDFEFGFSVWSCPTQAFWCDQIAFLYSTFFADLESQCQARFVGATVTVTPASSLWPAYALVLHKSYACFVTAGTDTLGQALVQILQGSLGPQDYGTFGSSKLWYDFATQIISVFNAANALDGRPLLLAGHSYGGAGVLVCAARLSQLYPKTEVRYITYGAPKPGDGRMRDLLDGRYDGLSLVNDGDFITALPPSNAFLEAMSGLWGLGIVLNWTRWAYPPETTLLYQTSVLKNTYQRYDSSALVTWINTVINAGKLTTLTPHLIGEYQKRIALRCAAFIPTAVGLVLGMIRTSSITELVLSPCCPTGTPKSLTFAFSAVAPPNDSLNGLHGALAWQGTGPQWAGFLFSSFGVSVIGVECDITNTWTVFGDAPVQFSGGLAPTCGIQVFNVSILTSAGLSTGTITITP